jgi:hypothetical protein
VCLWRVRRCVWVRKCRSLRSSGSGRCRSPCGPTHSHNSCKRNYFFNSCNHCCSHHYDRGGHNHHARPDHDNLNAASHHHDHAAAYHHYRQDPGACGPAYTAAQRCGW